MADNFFSLSDDIIGTIFQSTQRIVDDDTLAEQMALAVGLEGDELLDGGHGGFGLSLDSDAGVHSGMSSPMWESSMSPASDSAVSDPASASSSSSSDESSSESEDEAPSPRPAKRRRESTETTDQNKRTTVGGKRPRTWHTEPTPLTSRDSLDIIKQLTKTIAALPVSCIMGIVDIIHPDMGDEMKQSGELIIDLSSLDTYKLARLQEFVQRELEATLSRAATPQHRRASVTSAATTTHGNKRPTSPTNTVSSAASTVASSASIGPNNNDHSINSSSNTMNNRSKQRVQKDRERERERHAQKERERERERHAQKERERERERHAQKEKERERERHAQKERELSAYTTTPPSPKPKAKLHRGGKSSSQQRHRTSHPPPKPRAKARAVEDATGAVWPTSLMAQCDDDDGEIDILGI